METTLSCSTASTNALAMEQSRFHADRVTFRLDRNIEIMVYNGHEGSQQSTDSSLKTRNDERRAAEIMEGRREGRLSLRNEVEKSIQHASTSTPFAKQR
ncbi:hypothetical protein ALC53_11122 [Atta colombica]|uniref:Uncharacterized protein n=1 Tax=Atta colombica TaxID=520822 RepID=A0A195B2F0_9HYME|nr:hypothetical protein ALC53_11122 [Atta colombica]